MSAPAGALPRPISTRLAAWIGVRGTLAGGAALSLAICGLSLFGGLAWHASPYAIHGHHTLMAPTREFPLGTDQIGRDLLARLIAGGRATLIVALPASALGLLLGITYGLAAALGPRWLDATLMRLLDAVLALPGLVMLIFFAALFTPDTFTLILLLGLTAWPGLARLVRNEAIAQRGRDFILAARQFGGGAAYVARVHILRMIAPILAVNGTFLVGDQILALSGLSFLGLGVQPPMASWGGLLESGLNLIALDPWWMILPPGLMIFLSILAANLIGQGLLARQDAAR
jgi:peptide/nickel transport system permease protein